MDASARKFLNVPGPGDEPAASRYVVLPVPYEATVCYKPGTAEGPAAIIEAARQVELLDEETGREFHKPGVALLEPVVPAEDGEEQMRRVRQAAAPHVAAGKFLLTLGGEHSIAAPIIELAAERHGPISVLQIDAHGDLRETYGGTRRSHACVMRRVLEITDRLCQVGVRSYSRDEQEACPRQVANFITPALIRRDARWIDRALGLLGERVYVTIDMDGLDPSIAPGVGTPEPDGLSWPQVTALLRRLCAERQVVSADIVETRPIPPHHVTEFVAARLACKIIAYTQS